MIDKLVDCMKSKHHSVAERALLVWGEDAIEILIDLDKKTIWPKIVGAFLENKNHWNESLKECNEEAMDVFRVRDHATFTKIKEEFQQKGTIAKEQQAREVCYYVLLQLVFCLLGRYDESIFIIYSCASNEFYSS